MSRILLIAALICFLLVTFGVSSDRINLTGLGLACWVGASLV